MCACMHEYLQTFKRTCMHAYMSNIHTKTKTFLLNVDTPQEEARVDAAVHLIQELQTQHAAANTDGKKLQELETQVKDLLRSKGEYFLSEARQNVAANDFTGARKARSNAARAFDQVQIQKTSAINSY